MFHPVMRIAGIRIVAPYVLVLAVISLGHSGQAYSSETEAQFPRVLCTATQVLNGTFQVSLCTQKLSYKTGEVANLTIGFENLQSSITWARYATKIEVVFEQRTVFSDTVFCGIPEGCLFPPNETSPWTFHWPAEEQGTYQVIASLLYIETCSPPACRFVLMDPITIGLTIDVVPK